MIHAHCGAALFLAAAFVAASCTFALDEDDLRAGCPQGQSYCAGKCRSLDDPACCTGGSKRCFGTCVARDVVATGCGESHCAPCFFANAQAVCDSYTEGCAIGACVGSYKDCNREANDGCEVDADFDADNCGACARRCLDPPNALRGCASGVCGIGRCEVGYLDCDGRAGKAPSTIENGCEVDRFNDPANCGDCGIVCESGRCVEGVCR